MFVVQQKGTKNFVTTDKTIKDSTNLTNYYFGNIGQQELLKYKSKDGKPGKYISGKKEMTNVQALQQMVLQQVAGAIDEKPAPKYVSFAHVVQKLIVEELMSIKNKTGISKSTNNLDFDEIQVYFHKFNNDAGYMGDKNIGGFLINYSTLLSRFMHNLLQNSGKQISMQAAMNILSAFFNDPSDVMYQEPSSQEFKDAIKFLQNSHVDLSLIHI